MSSSVVQEPAPFSPPATVAIRPTSPDRIGAPDVLRGIALLGMFVVHFHDGAADVPDGSPAAAANVM